MAAYIGDPTREATYRGKGTAASIGAQRSRLLNGALWGRVLQAHNEDPAGPHPRGSERGIGVLYRRLARSPLNGAKLNGAISGDQRAWPDELYIGAKRVRVEGL